MRRNSRHLVTVCARCGQKCCVADLGKKWKCPVASRQFLHCTWSSHCKPVQSPFPQHAGDFRASSSTISVKVVSHRTRRRTAARDTVQRRNRCESTLIRRRHSDVTLTSDRCKVSSHCSACVYPTVSYTIGPNGWASNKKTRLVYSELVFSCYSL